MSGCNLDTPVAMIIYNRPAETAQVFERVAAMEPPELYIIADGPRDEADEDRCEATRDVINVDWNCTVHENLATSNLGLKRRFVTGLDWVFERTEDAIILEDDCVPTEEFFCFCETLLDRYRGDERIMQIAGTNELGSWQPDQADYHYSIRGSIWGWATWNDAWAENRPDMAGWESSEVRARIQEFISDPDIYRRRARQYQQVHEETVDTWDYQWHYSRVRNGGLSVVPSRNLVSNIGFGNEGTHTTNESCARANLETHQLEPPYSAPDFVLPDKSFDRAVYERFEQGRVERWLPASVYERLVRAKKQYVDRR